MFPLKNKEEKKLLYENLLMLLMVLLMCKNWEEASKTTKENSIGNDFLAYIAEDEFVSHSDAIKYVDAPIWLEVMN